MQDRYSEESQEPEPEKDVDLVVDHVDGKDAQTIKPGRLSSNWELRQLALTSEYFQTLRSYEKYTSSLWEIS